MKRDDFGVWEIVLPAINGEPAIAHNSKIKVCNKQFLELTETKLWKTTDFDDYTFGRAN